jgi:hypothetical protein
MSQRSQNDERQMAADPEETVFPGMGDQAFAARELHRRRVAAWAAAGGTFLLIVALWAMLLPTQLGGMPSFGFKNAPSWQSLRTQAALQAPAFQDSVNGMQRQLDAAEAQQRDVAQRAAAEQEAATLRARIETSTQSSSAAPVTNQPNPPTP